VQDTTLVSDVGFTLRSSSEVPSRCTSRSARFAAPTSKTWNEWWKTAGRSDETRENRSVSKRDGPPRRQQPKVVFSKRDGSREGNYSQQSTQGGVQRLTAASGK
jgi:hypothetical protein